MSKFLCFFTLFIFVVATSVAPMATSKIAAQAMQDGNTEQTFFSQAFEEEIHHESVSIFFVSTHVMDLPHPKHIQMTPQVILSPLLKPPLA